MSLATFFIKLSLATWEDAKPLKQKFPRTPAWGQAGSQERGPVTSLPGGPQDGGPEAELGRGKRRTRPNIKLTGPEWVQ